MTLLLPGTVILATAASFISHNSITLYAFGLKGASFKEKKMFRQIKQVLCTLSMIFCVSVELLQEQTFERVSVKYGKVMKSSQARSVRTCVDLCLQHCECRYVRFIKSTKECQLFDYVLLYYGSEQTPPSLDVVDFKKVKLRFFNS